MISENIDYKIKDIKLADFGRKEIEIAVERNTVLRNR